MKKLRTDGVLCRLPFLGQQFFIFFLFFSLFAFVFVFVLFLAILAKMRSFGFTAENVRKVKIECFHY